MSVEYFVERVDLGEAFVNNTQELSRLVFRFEFHGGLYHVTFRFRFLLFLVVCFASGW